MTAEIRMPATGRGAWPSIGRGGTLSSDGRRPGGFYRLAADGQQLVGLTGARAVRTDAPVNLDDYAVHRAVVAMQRGLGDQADPDGIYGPDTAAAVASWQAKRGLVDDGVLGPKTARAMWQPLLDAACVRVESSHAASLSKLARGHVGVESGWDCAAVGVTTPADVGLGQINGDAHPELSVDDRLDPATALAFVARFVDGNLAAFGYVERDAIAAYMLGQGGCRTWIKAGRPSTWQRLVGGVRTTVYVARYVDSVLAAAS